MFPPDPQTFVEAFWRGQNRRFALALHDDVLLFWEPDSPQFQSAPQEWVFAAEDFIPLPGRAQLNVHFLITAFQAAIQGRTLGRMLFPDRDKCVFLHPKGTGSILPPKPRGRGNTVSFRFDGGDEVFAQNASYWLERLARWTEESESDFAFALDWRGKNDEARAECLILLSRGYWDELRGVAQWILALEGHNCYSPVSNMPRTLIVRLRCFDGDFSLWVTDEDDEFSTRHKQLWNEWLRFFGMSLNSEVIERYTAASRCADRGFDWDYFRVTATQSQHEQLELRLQLRDWLRDRVGLSDQRIAELLA